MHLGDRFQALKYYLISVNFFVPLCIGQIYRRRESNFSHQWKVFLDIHIQNTKYSHFTIHVLYWTTTFGVLVYQTKYEPLLDRIKSFMLRAARLVSKYAQINLIKAWRHWPVRRNSASHVDTLERKYINQGYRWLMYWLVYRQLASS